MHLEVAHTFLELSQEMEDRESGLDCLFSRLVIEATWDCWVKGRKMGFSIYLLSKLLLSTLHLLFSHFFLQM